MSLLKISAHCLTKLNAITTDLKNIHLKERQDIEAHEVRDLLEAIIGTSRYEMWTQNERTARMCEQGHKIVTKYQPSHLQHSSDSLSATEIMAITISCLNSRHTVFQLPFCTSLQDNHGNYENCAKLCALLGEVDELPSDL